MIRVKKLRVRVYAHTHITYKDEEFEHVDLYGVSRESTENIRI